ncbi:MAG: glycosyltransferase family 1 protein [Opitutales bacterium]|nr:glycosyltransferase family 1 protein [Opitutales bacterium]
MKADATRSNFPQNVGKLGIPSVLVIGDTQHQQDPLQTLIRYAASEKYTVYTADHVRRHLHYFIEAGLKNVFWAPALNLRDWKIPFQQQRQIPLSFVGQAGKFHPYRSSILKRLSEEPDLGLKVGRATQEESSKVYATSQCTLNLSMNGDVNLRVFEVLAAGGCLLTDRLHRQAGMDLLFDEGVHLDTFGCYDELRDKCHFYRNNPDEALKMAWRGYNEYKRSHTPKRKQQQLIELAFKGWSDSAWNAQRDKRSLVCQSPDAPTLFNRIRNYEYFQQKQLEGEEQHLLFSNKANRNLACDTADLYRAQITSLDSLSQAFFKSAGVETEVRTTGNFPKERVSTYIISIDDVADGTFAQKHTELKTAQIMVEDFPLQPKELQTSVTAELRACGFMICSDTPAIFLNLN